MTYAAYQRVCQFFTLPDTDITYQMLCAYVALLCKWGSAYNLTAQANEAAIWQHIVDCLPAVALTPACVKKCLDVGSGAGLPGIVFAIMRPDITVTLVDSNGKKSRFLQRAVHEISLSTRVINSRIENHVSSQDGYEMITARAFSSLYTLVHLSRTWLADGALLLAIKGKAIAEEMNALNAFNKPLSIVTYPTTDYAPRTQVVQIRQCAHACIFS